MSSNLLITRLTNRKLLRITGPDCYPYLQGLLSNDIRLLYEEKRILPRKYAKNSRNVLSSFMLNPLGRAICDLLLYRTPQTNDTCEFTAPGKATQPDELLIECDSSLAVGLARTLYGYRVLRKIDVTVEENLATWCLYRKPIFNNEGQQTTSVEVINEAEVGLTVKDENVSKDLTVVNDPRIAGMGLRILSSEKSLANLKSKIESILGLEVRKGQEKDYLVHRYTMGIGEGVLDHPESNCFPLECNADLLGSVSFTKGCYLGQELTTRTHHTGVVRKRLVPVVLSENEKPENLIEGTEIVSEEGKPLGLLRYFYKNIGLALLRFEQAKNEPYLVHQLSKTKLSTYVPYWWNQSP